VKGKMIEFSIDRGAGTIRLPKILYSTIISSPLQVQIAKTSRAKIQKFRLNWNFYRAAHVSTINRGKECYRQEMEEPISNLPSMGKVFCVYTVYPKTRRKYDIHNVCAVHEKFFMDALVHGGKLPDDNLDYCLGSMYLHGALDRDNPRVDIKIFVLR
jgi:hypothetical protein